MDTLYLTDFNRVIKYCLENEITFEVNKRFFGENNIECIFNVRQSTEDNKIQDDKRVVYKVTADTDETDKIINLLKTYQSLSLEA